MPTLPHLDSASYAPSLLPLSATEAGAVEHLLDRAFGTDRHARTAYRVRGGALPVPALSFAAIEQDGTLAGSLQSWPVALTPPDGSAVPLVLVGPVAVLPERQRTGLGRRMMTEMLARADATGAGPLVLVGDPEYYGRFFGFTAEATAGWELPGPFDRHRLLARTGGATLPVRGMLGPRESD